MASSNVELIPAAVAAVASTSGMEINRPFRRNQATRLRLVSAALCSVLATGVFFGFYYLTLGHLPRAMPGAYATSPVGVWADRLDLAQFTGTFINPPYPSLLNWWLGFIVLGGALTSLGVAYALLLSWATQVSTFVKGACFGVTLFFVTGFTLWLAVGFHPAVMRQTLPDTGFFLLGWTGWATLQLAVCWKLFGMTLGASYRIAQRRAISRESKPAQPSSIG
jgi:hypothetical protein